MTELVLEGPTSGISGESIADDVDDEAAVLAGGLKIAADGAAVAGRLLRAEPAGDFLWNIRPRRVGFPVRSRAQVGRRAGSTESWYP